MNEKHTSNVRHFTGNTEVGKKNISDWLSGEVGLCQTILLVDTGDADK